MGQRPLAVFVMSIAPSHVLGSMGLARQLQDRGFDVQYWGGRALQLPCSVQGFVFRDVGQVWPCYEPVFSSGALRSLFRAEGFEALAVLRRRRAELPIVLMHFQRSVEREFAKRVPDLAIFDPLAVAYYPFFERRGVACVALNDKPVPAMDALVPPPTSSRVPRDNALGRALVRSLWMIGWLNDVGRRIRARSVDACGWYTSERLVGEIQRLAEPRNPPRRVARGVNYDLHFENIEEWVLGAAEIDLPRSSSLPKNVRYIGPCVDSRRVEQALAVPRKDGRRLVYVTMGTAPSMMRWDVDLALLRRIVSALCGVRDIEVLVAAGNDKACDALRPQAIDNVHVFPYLPQLTVLRSADLTITHGGAYTFRECIAAGVPMLAFPRKLDQAGNSARILYHGIGLRGSRRFDTPQTIRRKVLRILGDDVFKKRLGELSNLVRARESALLDAALARVSAASDGGGPGPVV